MTGLADQAGMRQGMELGADDYLSKPFTLDALYRAVDARLKKAQAVREQAERKLADLRDNISLMLPHELRTPLNGILAYGELLASDAASLGPEEISEMGQVIQASGRRLERLVENFLIYAQIELLATDPKKIRALRGARTESPAAVIEQQARAEAASVRRESDLVLELADRPLQISEEYLGRITAELVQNAFKFSDTGSHVRVNLAEAGNHLVLTVSDHGHGFPTEHLTRIGAYMQFDRKLNEQQGQGLGLVIAKRLAELHGATLSIQSEGEATTVAVNFPLLTAATTAAKD
jgi:signal transduction histidine kinase